MAADRLSSGRRARGPQAPRQVRGSTLVSSPAVTPLGPTPGTKGIPWPLTTIDDPPSTIRAAPVTNDDSSDARKTAGPATSSGRPIRPVGWIPFARARSASGSGNVAQYSTFACVSM